MCCAGFPPRCLSYCRAWARGRVAALVCPLSAPPPPPKDAQNTPRNKPWLLAPPRPPPGSRSPIHFRPSPGKSLPPRSPASAAPRPETAAHLDFPLHSLAASLPGPTAWQDEALARHGVSREVPCSALKGETVPDSLPATPKSPPTRRVPPRLWLWRAGAPL